MQLWNVKWPYLGIMLCAVGAEIYEVYDNFPLFDEYGILVRGPGVLRARVRRCSGPTPPPGSCLTNTGSWWVMGTKTVGQTVKVASLGRTVKATCVGQTV